MKSQVLQITAIVAATIVQGYEFVRLNKTDAALLIVDHQIGLATLVRDYEPTVFRQSVIAHAAIGNLFNLPTIMTTSAETGPNGKLPKEVTDLHPNAPYIKRNGEVDAWDNPEFKAAVKATGKSQMIIAGIVTEVCTSFLALSLRAEGYEVFANTEASGTFNDKLAADANRRMEGAGVHLMGMFGIVADLQRDWRNTSPNATEVFAYMDKYQAPVALMARHYSDAISSAGNA
ncbi:Isochorismatase-like hydrolase [Glarea lozoyensis ATCC 20868]|uniref:Isochorismatase-like hydrolase n=1 Tax=Glarea lozoyensis (strain ATCC 20868 / MF5171) TaxID=1116229 RepID=S3DGV3_GLAL2|nr:Isochorismatase-like hydrolase [Glarea lozoyensis ATCC 20868]EPE36930.1 Isochorismatase-like hydrolase [Glarea lozoyensis ATCC 20868]